MERVLKRTSDLIFLICKYILIFLIVEIAVIIGANIFGRYFLNMSIYWAEEVTRYSFVWATFLGAACAYKQRGLVSMSVVVHKMPPQLRRKVGLVLDTAMGVFLLIAFVYGIKLTLAVVNQRSASLEISMSIVYICIPLACLCMLIFNLTQIVSVLKNKQILPIWGEDWT
jgi:TRAP-type C4-dicarboxylate transport system permease small subunit